MLITVSTAEPRQQHWTAAKQILRYLRGTLDQELHYQKCEKGPQLEGYNDADYNQLTGMIVGAQLDTVSV